MAVLKLNGWELEISPRRADERYRSIGESSRRSLAGQGMATRRGVKREWPLRAGPKTPAEARALRGLLLGDGHRWNFEGDLYSSKKAESTGGNVQFTPLAKYGSQAVRVLGPHLTYNLEFPAVWTLMGWVNPLFDTGDFAFLSPNFPAPISTSAPSGWTHYAERSDGAKWLDGARDDGATTGFWEISAGVMTLEAPHYYDDIVAVPYPATEAQIQGHHGLGRPYPPLPLVEIEGAILDTGVDEIVQCRGVGVSASLRPWGRPDTGWVEGGRDSVEFTLREA